MSQAEAARFVDDLKGNGAMQEALKAEAATLNDVIAFAKGKGYDLDLDDARAYIHAQAKQDLNDEELDSVSGGKSSSDVDIDIPGTVATTALSFVVAI